MAGSAVRAIYPKNGAKTSWPVFVIAVLFCSMASPGIIASADQRIEARDFQILEDLELVLLEDNSIKADPQARDQAGESLDEVRNSIRESGNDSPIVGTETMLSDIEKIETLPPEVQHPRPYEILTDPEQAPPGEVRNIWSTILNITDYAVWVEYQDQNGEKRQNIELSLIHI